MRRYLPLLLVPALSSVALWATSCQDSLRDNLPLRSYDLAKSPADLAAPAADLTPPPDLTKPPAMDGGADGGLVDAMPNG